MLLIVGTVRLPPDKVSSAGAAMQKMIAASRNEDGCLHYSYAEDILDKGLIHVKEIWTSRSALENHFRTAHLAAWRACWSQFGIHDRNLASFEVGDPQPV